jgi:hypothetical protein
MKLCFCRGYLEIRKDGPTHQIKIDIYLRHRLRKTLEDTRRRVEEDGRPPVGLVGRPWDPRVSLPLLTLVLHRLRVCIYAIVSSQFDPRAPVHSMGLYKQSLHPLASNSTHKSQT